MNAVAYAGQAIVQMARSKTSGLEFAIKFFISSTAFAAERAMYKREGDSHSNDLAHFLPKVHCVEENLDGALKDVHGHALPPCIVMERGESLDIWAARAKPDRSQAFTVRFCYVHIPFKRSCRMFMALVVIPMPWKVLSLC